MKTGLLKDILDGLTELIYIADPETYELLYMNDEGIRTFGISEFKGQPCYKVLQGRDTPCDFCTNHLLSHDKYYTWQKTNPVTGQTYLLKDKMIVWEDKPARIEIAFDQKEQIEKEAAMQNLLDIETVLVKCITELHGAVDIALRIQKMIQIVGEFLNADRSYVFLIHEDKMNNAYEWCKNGVRPEIKNLQELDIHLIDRWLDNFNKGECVKIYNVEDIKDNKEEYEIIKSQNIKSLIAAPLEVDGRLIGYMGVDNPPHVLIEKIAPFFTTLSYFLSSSIVKYRNELMLEQMSFVDALTGLNNRNRYMADVQQIEQLVEVNIGIFYVDMNGLKVVNDTFGHDYGDNYLKRISDVLKHNFHSDMIYRLGGDEFIVIDQECRKEEFDKKKEILSKEFKMYDCSVSVGYQYVDNGKNIQEGIKQADEYMYENKKQFYRSNLVIRYRHYNDEFMEFANKDFLLKLIQEHRFSIYLQPKLSIKDRRVQGAEVLVRYTDAHDHLIAPDQFIPILEKSGLIYLLDFFVLDRTCRMIVKWLESGYNVYPVSINLSQTTLLYPECISYLQEIWNRYDLPKHLLELEISKTDDESSLDQILVVVQELKNEGFHIVIDDFGTNQTNVFLFSSVDFDVMKLEKSLVQKLLTNERVYSLVTSLVEVCHKLGVSIVAKGVENMELLNVIEGMNIDEVQGFLFSGPLSLDEFTTKYIERDKKS